MPKITLSGEKLAMAMAHATERGMTFEEYVQEYVQLVQEQMKKEWLAQHENAMVSGGSVWWCVC